MPPQEKEKAATDDDDDDDVRIIVTMTSSSRAATAISRDDDVMVRVFLFVHGISQEVVGIFWREGSIPYAGISNHCDARGGEAIKPTAQPSSFSILEQHVSLL